MHRRRVTVLGVAAGLLLTAAPAGAELPRGNLLANPGAEAASGSTSGNDVFTLPGWTVNSAFSPRVTAVRYGAPGFPSAAQGAALGGGANFFAGGPSAPGDNNLYPQYYSALLTQQVEIPPLAQADVAAGGVQLALSGCLGGYAGQDDRSSVFVSAQDSAGVVELSFTVAHGPDAVARGNVTKLIPTGTSVPLDPRARKLLFGVEFHRASGAGTYNDGYADNLALRLIGPGQPVPPPDCPPAGTGTTPGGSGPAAGKPTGTNSAAGLSRVGKRLRLKGRYALVKLRCGLRDSACRGRLTLRSKGKKLGSTRYSIAAGKQKTVKIKLSRKTRKRLRGLSRKRLTKVKFAVTATVGKQTTKFSLGATR